MRAGHSRNQLNKVTITRASPVLLSLCPNWVWLHLFKSTVEERERRVEVSRWNWSVSARPDMVAFQKIGKKKGAHPLLGLLNKGCGGEWRFGGSQSRSGRSLTETSNPGLCLHMLNHLWWSQLISSVSGSADTPCTLVRGHPHRHVTHEHVHKRS